MRDRTKFGGSSRSRKISVLPAFLTLLLAGSLVAQKTPKPTSPKYDLHTEVKTKGTIEEVKLPPKGSEKEIVHLLVRNGTDSVDVYLCPKSFFDDMGMDFSKGDGITLTGSKVKQGEAEFVLAEVAFMLSRGLSSWLTATPLKRNDVSRSVPLFPEVVNRSIGRGSVRPKPAPLARFHV